MCFDSCQQLYLLHNELSIFTLDFQHITKNCQTQSSLIRVDNHAVEIKNYYDGYEMSDRCGTTMFTFETDVENPVIMFIFKNDLGTL